MATISGSNCPAVQNGTPAGTVNNTSASFPKFFLHRWVIKRGITNTCGHWGWASRSSPNKGSIFDNHPQNDHVYSNIHMYIRIYINSIFFRELIPNMP